MSFPKTVVVSGTNNSPWNVINAPMWGPVQVTFNVTQSGATSWSIQLTNTNILANTQVLLGPSGPVAITPNAYAAPAALTTQTGASSAIVPNPFFAWMVTNTGAGTVTVETVESGIN